MPGNLWQVPWPKLGSGYAGKLSWKDCHQSGALKSLAQPWLIPVFNVLLLYPLPPKIDLPNKPASDCKQSPLQLLFSPSLAFFVWAALQVCSSFFHWGQVSSLFSFSLVWVSESPKGEVEGLLMELFCQENHNLFGTCLYEKNRIKWKKKVFFFLLKIPLWDITVQIYLLFFFE